MISNFRKYVDWDGLYLKCQSWCFYVNKINIALKTIQSTWTVSWSLTWFIVWCICSDSEVFYIILSSISRFTRRNYSLHCAMAKKRPSDVLTKEQNLLFVVVNCRCPLLNRCIQYRYIEHMIRLLYHCTLSIVARNANNGTSQLTPTNTLKCAKLIYIQNSTKRFCTFFFVLHKYEQWWN